MWKRKILVLFIFILGVGIYADDPHLKYIKSIGNDSENDHFYWISGAVIGKNNDIYVLDSKANTIARYDWEGTLIKQMGRKGQGPGDFAMPRFLDILEDKLYFFDGGNLRIAVTDLNLDELQYHRLQDGIPFLNNFFALDENNFIGATFAAGPHNEFNGIKIADINSGTITSFFDHTPIKIYKKIDASSKKTLLKSFFFIPRFGMDKSRQKILVGFFRPDNPVKFFLYSSKGQYLDDFSYKIESKYRFPGYLLEYPVNYPHTSYVPLLGSIFFHQNRYIIFLSKVTYRGKHTHKKEKQCLVFNRENHSLYGQIQVPSDLETFFLSHDGYLLGTRRGEDIQKLYIYKLQL